MPDLGRYVRSTETMLFDVTVEGEFYKDGSSYPWKGGTYAAVVAADSPAEAVIEALDGRGHHGIIEPVEGGDTDRELVIRVKPVPDVTEADHA